MTRRPPRSTLFPYTTLFRSGRQDRGGQGQLRGETGFDLLVAGRLSGLEVEDVRPRRPDLDTVGLGDRKSTRLNSSHMSISYAVFCLKKKKKLARSEIGHVHK